MATVNTGFVGDGKLLTEVVISTTHARTAFLAAHELQSDVEKIAEARLNTVDYHGDTFPVRIFVGNTSTRMNCEPPRIACSAERTRSFPVKTG